MRIFAAKIEGTFEKRRMKKNGGGFKTALREERFLERRKKSPKIIKDILLDFFASLLKGDIIRNLNNFFQRRFQSRQAKCPAKVLIFLPIPIQDRSPEVLHGP